MKTINQVVIGAFALLLASAIRTFAVEGLQISGQCSNVVLSWPSIAGQNYIVQYRSTLNPSTPWVTLTSSLPADWTTNISIFVHSNIVLHPNCGGSGVGSFAMMSSGSAARSKAAVASASTEPMAMLPSVLGSTVPVRIYPPGFDFTGFLIFDPSSDEWISGAGYSRSSALSFNGAQSDGPEPPGGGGGSGGDGTDITPDMGFYQVVQDGVQILDSSVSVLTNGILSDTINIGFEAGNAASDGTGTNVLGTLNYAVLVIDGGKFVGESVLSAPPSYPWRFAMDTAYLENGDHTLQVEVGWKNADSGKYPYFSRVSDAVTITVSNQIYYPDWEEEIGEADISAYFVKTTCTNADWRINIYDAGSNLVQSLVGHTTDGTI